MAAILNQVHWKSLKSLQMACHIANFINVDCRPYFTRRVTFFQFVSSSKSLDNNVYKCSGGGLQVEMGHELAWN